MCLQRQSIAKWTLKVLRTQGSRVYGFRGLRGLGFSSKGSRAYGVQGLTGFIGFSRGLGLQGFRDQQRVRAPRLQGLGGLGAYGAQGSKGSFGVYEVQGLRGFGFSRVQGFGALRVQPSWVASLFLGILGSAEGGLSWENTC